MQIKQVFFNIIFIFVFLILFPGCSDGSDDNDSDNNDDESIPPVVAVTNLCDNSIVETGFLIGTAFSESGIALVEVSLDGGNFSTADGTSEWIYKLPTGGSTWAGGSGHTISVRAEDKNGNVSDVVTISVLKGSNKDYNGDGYTDVIAGAPYYDSGNTDEGMVFVYFGSESGLSVSADWTAEGSQEDAEFGYSVSSAGDVNGDGYADMIAGSPYYDNGETDEGMAFVYYGSESGFSTSADWTAEGDQDSAEFGYSVSTAGDVNGDGFDDLIIGAPIYSNGEPGEGTAFVYFGSESGLSTSADWTAESNKNGENLGWSVSTAGDVNGDGFGDVITGIPFYSNGEISEGAAFVYYGSESGLSTSADWTAEGDQEYTKFGCSVSTAGDVNGDGFGDVIVGAERYSNGETDEGMVFVYFGSESGLSTSADWTAEGNQDNANLGCSVSSAGDVNGNGFCDVIVGADSYDNGQSSEGMVFVYFGSESGLSTSADWTVESNQNSAYFGCSVSSAGDVNGNGYCDIIAGARFYDNGETNEGEAFVYYNSESGLSSSPDWIAEGGQADAQFGWSVGG